jgi:hypothetical protein
MILSLATLCPYEQKGNLCRVKNSRCRFLHVKSNLCQQFEKEGYCHSWSTTGRCRKVHDLAGKGVCSECGTNKYSNKTHWKPLPECFHLRDTAIPSELRKGGLTADRKAFKCCGCKDVSDRNYGCSYHRGRSCRCPRCPECESESHLTPTKECYHVGMWGPARIGGWTPSEEGMAADWHCCGCSDNGNRHCDDHRIHRSCGCFNRERKS